MLLSVVGSVVGFSEPQLLKFIAERMPTDNPITKQLLATVRKQQDGSKKNKKKRT